MKQQILVFLPDPHTGLLLCNALKLSGFSVTLAKSEADFTHGYRSGEYQFAVIDQVHSIPGLMALNPLGNLIVYTRLAEPRVIGLESSVIPKNVPYIHANTAESFTDLLEAIGNAGAKNIPVRLRHHLLSKNAFSELTRSQIHVLRLISEGKTNLEIAALRGTTVRAVENLSKRLMLALNIKIDSMSAAKIVASRVYFEVTGAILPPTEQSFVDNLP